MSLDGGHSGARHDAMTQSFVSIRVDVRAATRHLTDIEKRQVPFATALALTRTAQQAKLSIEQQMRTAFDRPTPFVLKSFRLIPATKSRLVAEVSLKDRDFGQSTTAAADAIGHHFVGGGRVPKRFELVLRSRGFLAAGEYVVAGAAARLDQYGNVSRGQIQQVLSQLRIRTAGFDNAPTASRRSRRNVRRAGRIFWSYGQGSPGPGAFSVAHGERIQNLPKGAWVDLSGRLAPIFLAVAAPRYKRLFDLEKTARDAIIKHFSREFHTALARSLATAR